MKIICNETELENTATNAYFILKQFLTKNKIETGGAISEYEITLSRKDNGDEWIEIELPFWSHNEYVVDSVLNFIVNIRKEFNNVSIHLRDNKTIVRIYTNLCDPD